MFASYQWIRDLLPDLALDAQAAADRLTLSGTEVESVEDQGEDQVMDVGVTSNRVDCLCHLGLARELAALEGLEVREPDVEVTEAGAPTAEGVQVTIEDEARCGRYVARIIEGVKVAPSPGWLVARLEAIGLRSVNNVVDVTNFVMFEMNQPLHAFDLDLVKGPEIVVRSARKGEKLKVINGRELELSPEDLVIADAQAPVALAGVMGGGDSEVTESTTRILLESAWFEPGEVRRASRRHALSSDSSHRFERRVDRSSTALASQRAAKLIMEVAGGSLRPAPLDQGNAGAPPASLTLRAATLERVCGISIPAERVEAILTALRCVVERGAEASWKVTPPRFRADLVREIDLVEEVIRVYGYDHVPEDGGMGVRVVNQHPMRELREDLSDRLAGYGALETITADFVSKADAELSFLVAGEALSVRNPVRSNEAFLRLSVLGSLLKVRKLNQDQGVSALRIFESARVMAAPTGDDSLPSGRQVLGLLVDDGPRELRGLIEALLGTQGIAVQIEATPVPGMDEKASAALVCGEQRVGVIGRPDAATLKRHGLKSAPNYAELDLEALRRLVQTERKFQSLPRFPASERDLAVLLERSVPYARVEEVVRALDIELLDELDLFDLFRPKGLSEDRHSLGLRFRFRAADRTLTSAEIDAAMGRVQAALESELGGVIRAN